MIVLRVVYVKHIHVYTHQAPTRGSFLVRGLGAASIATLVYWACIVAMVTWLYEGTMLALRALRP